MLKLGINFSISIASDVSRMALANGCMGLVYCLVLYSFFLNLNK